MERVYIILEESKNKIRKVRENYHNEMFIDYLSSIEIININHLLTFLFIFDKQEVKDSAVRLERY